MARRLGAEDSESRTALLDATQALMLESGHASISSRKVAAKADLKPQLVHYYFRTMDDLLLAVLQRAAEQGLERQRAALAGPQPMWALWEYSTEPTGAALAVELNALALHNPAIRDELASFGERFRSAQIDAIESALAGHDLPIGAIELSVLMQGMSRYLSMEAGIGITTGHAEMVTLVESVLTQLEGPRQR